MPLKAENCGLYSAIFKDLEGADVDLFNFQTLGSHGADLTDNQTAGIKENVFAMQQNLPDGLATEDANRLMSGCWEAVLGFFHFFIAPGIFCVNLSILGFVRYVPVFGSVTTVRVTRERLKTRLSLFPKCGHQNASPSRYYSAHRAVYRQRLCRRYMHSSTLRHTTRLA